MTFKVVARKRDDGDFDTVAAFNVEEFKLRDMDATNEAKDLQEILEDETVILTVANVTNVIKKE